MQRQKCSGAQLSLSSRTRACMRYCRLTNYFCLHMGAAGSNPPGISPSSCTAHVSWHQAHEHEASNTHSHMTHTQLCSWGLHSPMVVWPVFCCATWSHMRHGRNIGNKFTCFNVYLLLGWPLRLKPLFPFSIFTRQACCRMCYVDGFARAIEVLTEPNHYQASVLASLLQEK